jgi:hypothetical protein
MPHLRFTIRRLMITVAVVSVILGGILWMVRPLIVEVRIAPQPLRANVDHEIFDIVLTDMGSSEFRDQAKATPSEPSKVIVSAYTEEGRPEDITEIRGKLGEWVKDGKIELDVIQNMNDRNPPRVRFSLSEYKPWHPRFVVKEIKSGEYGYSFGGPGEITDWFEPQLPGYSKDGQSAIIRFSFGPTPHGAVGYYLLKKVKGRWEIVDKELLYSS